MPVEARAAWQAFQSMSESKSAHLALLEQINEKREGGETPTIAEQLRLESLLAEHDKSVAKFSAEMKFLRRINPEALQQLLSLINQDANSAP